MEEIKKEKGFCYVICAEDGQENRIKLKLGPKAVNCVKGHRLEEIRCPQDGAVNKLRNRKRGLNTQCSQDGASLILLPEDKGIDKIDAATLQTYPEDMQTKYKLFTEKCNKCHSLARPLNIAVSAKVWQKYIKRMMRRPSCDVSNAEARQIYQFLKFYESKRK